MADQEDRVRGLKSVQEHRETRGKMRWPPAKYWGYAGVVIALMGIFHYKRTLSELDSVRAQLLGKQRVVKAEIEPKWAPLRDKIEGWTMALAKGPVEDFADRDVLDKWTFRDKKGVYLRLRAEDADTPENIRKAAKDSLRDGFTACLGVYPNANPLAGHECKSSSDCAAGEHCNELDRCSVPAQPGNLRIAYRAFYVLGDEWVRQVQDGSEMAVRALGGSFDDLLKNEMRTAADLVRDGEYFVVVIDEKAEGEAAPQPGATASFNAGESRQAMQHYARIGVWRLKDDKPLVRIRRETAGQLLGASGALDPQVAEARQRQANSCSLALAVRESIGDKSATPSPPP